ncbi:MAG: hypothetical protein ACI4XF_03780, partial [Oscillospiraceae bacterium]
MSEDCCGYNIDIGGIAGTEIADKLNEVRPQIVEVINQDAQYAEEKYNEKFSRLTEDDVDFNSTESVYSILLPQVLYSGYEYDLTYDEFLEYSLSDYTGRMWSTYTLKDDTVFMGLVYEDNNVTYRNCVETDNLKFVSDGAYSGEFYPGEESYGYIYFRAQLAALLKQAGEESTDIQVGIAEMDYDLWRYHMIIFVDGKAKYMCDSSFKTELLMCTYLRDDTPEPVREYLSEQAEKLENVRRIRTND